MSNYKSNKFNWLQGRPSEIVPAEFVTNCKILTCSNTLTLKICRRLSGLNSEMQVQNLRFNRRYSLLVGLLIVIQILLAALTIDWGKLDDKLGSGIPNIKGMDSKQSADDKVEHNNALQRTSR